MINKWSMKVLECSAGMRGTGNMWCLPGCSWDFWFISFLGSIGRILSTEFSLEFPIYCVICFLLCSVEPYRYYWKIPALWSTQYILWFSNYRCWIGVDAGVHGCVTDACDNVVLKHISYICYPLPLDCRVHTSVFSFPVILPFLGSCLVRHGPVGVEATCSEKWPGGAIDCVPGRGLVSLFSNKKVLLFASPYFFRVYCAGISLSENEKPLNFSSSQKS